MKRDALVTAVTEIILKHVPEEREDSSLESMVADLVRFIEPLTADSSAEPTGRRLVITAIGRDQVGIIHAFSGILAERNVDILDVNQTILRGNFAMMMIVDPAASNVSFQELKEAMKSRAEELGVKVYVQYEDLMRAVSRI